MEERDRPRWLYPRRFDPRVAALVGLFLITLLAAFRVAKVIVLPLVLAFLLSFLLTPAVRGLRRLRLPRPVAAAFVLFGLLALLAYAGYRLSGPAGEWLQKAPRNVDRIEREIRELMGPVETVSEATESVERLTEMGDGQEKEPSVKIEQESLGQRLFKNARGAVTIFILTVILTFFLLAQGHRLVRKILRLLPKRRDKKKVLEISRCLQRDLSTYLGTITLINLGLGATIGLAMWGLGVPNPVLWGVMGTLLNFVPYLGAIVGIGVLAVVALITFDGLWNVLFPPLAYLLLTGVEGYFLTPMIVGRWLTQEPLVVLLSIVFWGWLWGATGAILAVPLLVCTKIFCENIAPLKPLGMLLGR